MTDDNYYRRLLGLPPLQPTGLLGGIPLSAIAQALGSPAPSPPSIPLSMLPRLLADPSPPPSARGLGALAGLLGSDTPSMTNPFRDYGIPMKSGLGAAMTDNLFARTPPSSTNYFDYIPKAPPVQNALTGYGIPVNATPTPAALPDTRRKTFFSFHFEDSFRVNQVRKSGLIRPKRGGRMPVWWHDSSIYEKSKRTDDASLRRLILDGLYSTSVTCVLAGEETWEREWVRFEIASSVKRGNGLLTVYIHNLQCPNNGFGNPGQNPLDFMGVYISDDGKAYLCEKDWRDQWVQYDKIKTPVTWPKYLPKPSVRNWAQPLSAGTCAYDYDYQDGYNNLSIWVQDAAVAAGR